MECYACDQEATQNCSRCGNAYCPQHGNEQGLCASCLDPVNAAPSSATYRLALFALLGFSVLALWLIVRPPSLPGESSGAIRPLPTTEATPTPPVLATPEETPAGDTPAPSAEPTPAPTEPPAGPIEYTVVDGDTWYGIADAFGVDAEQLAAYNGYTLEDFINPGQVLLIPQ